MSNFILQSTNLKRPDQSSYGNQQNHVPKHLIKYGVFFFQPMPKHSNSPLLPRSGRGLLLSACESGPCQRHRLPPVALSFLTEICVTFMPKSKTMQSSPVSFLNCSRRILFASFVNSCSVVKTNIPLTPSPPPARPGASVSRTFVLFSSPARGKMWAVGRR